MPNHERRVWIAQCLCPDRHCILAALGEADSPEDAETEVAAKLRRQVAELVKQGAINPWCAICGARQPSWRVETGRTRWRTLPEAEADPLFQQLRAANDLTRAVFGDLHRTRPN